MVFAYGVMILIVTAAVFTFGFVFPRSNSPDKPGIVPIVLYAALVAYTVYYVLKMPIGISVQVGDVLQFRGPLGRAVTAVIAALP